MNNNKNLYIAISYDQFFLLELIFLIFFCLDGVVSYYIYY